ncbi:hypothetical protein JB92DRAFT_3111654 [Gautieria morchelliformis]|nr:hypothetical protein JB92DRAFT_3111654 [Gautieria morchelliformis]
MTSGPPEASEGHPNLITGTGQPSTAPPGTSAQGHRPQLNFRNTQRSARRINGDTNVSDDEDLLSEQQLADTFAILSRRILTNPTNSSIPPNPTGLTATATVPSTTTLPIPDISQPSLLSIPGTSSNIPKTNTNAATAAAPTSTPNTNPSWTFSAAMVIANMQQTIIHTIPAQLITMFQHRVYVPLSFFLIKNMERIRLE